MKKFLIVVLLGLLAWFYSERIPSDYQFWKKTQTLVTVQNNSDQDIREVLVFAWNNPHLLGQIPKGSTREVKGVRPRNNTDVMIRFQYNRELIERQAGTINEDSGKMMISINYAGVITASVEPPGDAFQNLLR